MTKTKLGNFDYIPPTWYSYLNYDVGPRNTRTYNHALTAFVSNAYNTHDAHFESGLNLTSY